MRDAAISVEGLGKMYRLSHRAARADSFRELITGAIAAPFKRLAGGSGEIATEDFWALRDISFEVTRGHAVGLVGRNGAGKSTLLKILSRIVEPTEGRAVLRGRLASLLEVGTGFHPDLTGRENVYLNGSILGMKKVEIDRKFDEIVAFAEIEKFLDTPVKRYSSGMYVRLAFSVAAHLEPEILVVDEVLAVGDAEFQRKCLGKMKDVTRGSERTVLFVSHNMNAVATLCSRAVLLDRGRMVMEGPTDRVLEAYAGSEESEDSIDLETSGRRASGVSAVLRRLEMFDAAGKPSSRFQPGSEARLRLTIDAGRRVPTPRVGIGFNNWRGERVFAVATYLAPSELRGIDGRGCLEVSFNVPALMPGKYSMDVSLADAQGPFLDAVEGVGALEVADINYLDTTHPYFSEMGHVLVRSRWSSTE